MKNREEKKGLLYKVTSPSGKVYVGKTIQDLNTRKLRHLRESKKESNNYFHNAIKKYGSALKWEIIQDNIDESQLSNMEIYYINKFDSYNNGYNSTQGGEGGNTYSLLSPSDLEKVKNKIKESLFKRKNNPLLKEILEKEKQESAERMKGSKNPMYGKTSAMKGKKHTKMARDKISTAKKIKKNIKNIDIPRFIQKPWGSETILGYTEKYCFKKIIIKKGYATSLQYHNLKIETSFVDSGTAKVWLKRAGEKDYTVFEKVEPGFILNLDRGDIHRIEALEDIVLFEASTPEIWDVVRLEDSYGREGTSNP